MIGRKFEAEMIGRENIDDCVYPRSAYDDIEGRRRVDHHEVVNFCSVERVIADRDWEGDKPHGGENIFGEAHQRHGCWAKGCSVNLHLIEARKVHQIFYVAIVDIDPMNFLVGNVGLDDKGLSVGPVIGAAYFLENVIICELLRRRPDGSCGDGQQTWAFIARWDEVSEYDP